MAETVWWAKEPAAELSQGDIFENVPFYVCAAPIQNLRFRPLKGGARGWEEFTAPTLHQGKKNILAHKNRTAAVVISHDCEIDKDARHILVAPVHSLSALDLSFQAQVTARAVLKAPPLMELPKLGNCYCDLRLITAIPRELLPMDRRIASMSDAGRKAFGHHLVAFLLRIQEDDG